MSPTADPTATQSDFRDELAQLVSRSRECNLALDQNRVLSSSRRGEPPDTTTVAARHSSLSAFDDALAIDDRVSIVDSAADDRVRAISVQWGVAAHCLAAVPSWQKAYDLAIANEGEDPSQPPVHIDARWMPGDSSYLESLGGEE